MAIEAGKLISEEMSMTIRQGLSASDYLELSEETGVSDSMMYKVARREKKTTERTIPAVYAMLKRALNNTRGHKKDLEIKEAYLEEALNETESAAD